MKSACTNIYKTCREAAGMSQERWAEALEISQRSVANYETGLSRPSDAVVVDMIAVSGCDWLALSHLQESSAELDVLPDVEITTLPQATISLINKILGFADRHRDRQLLQIAEDGVIDEAERPLFEAILQDLRDLIAAALQVRYAADKKSRPEADTSARHRKSC